MKEMKKMGQVLIFLTVAVLLLFAGCSKKETTGRSDGSGKYKIAYLVRGLDDVWHNVTATATKKYFES
ncbi:MAG: hypothetical protein LBT13_01685, partial [Treponema sp.]|nr:hypothetical protein [Treponema sp.]